MTDIVRSDKLVKISCKARVREGNPPANEIFVAILGHSLNTLPNDECDGRARV
jgi:hypothetical protein